jgi:putative glutamine amidotransferase
MQPDASEHRERCVGYTGGNLVRLEEAQEIALCVSTAVFRASSSIRRCICCGMKVLLIALGATLLLLPHDSAASSRSTSKNTTPRKTVVRKTMRPVIGINASFSREENQNPSVSVRANYVDAVTSAGGIPIILPPLASTNDVDQQIAACDGFIFVGGPDIDPARFGEEPHPTMNPMSPRREVYDFELIDHVIKARKPFLAICLGCQQVNVALGGSLIQDINSQTSTTIQHSRRQIPYTSRHDVEVEPKTKLHDLVGTRTLSTNTAHHQAVDRPGEGVKVTSRTDDGVIESFELRDYPFGLGIQWHPEYLVAEKEHRALFEGLVREAKKQREKRK